MTLIEDLNQTIIDRCIVCGSERSERVRRTIRVLVGGVYAELELRIEYCADDAACGEEKARHLADELAAPFIVKDLRRRGLSLLDLGVPDG